MAGTSFNYKNNQYRFITVAVDRYEERQLKGKINHDALQDSAEYSGWTDFMIIANQILERVKAPRLTFNMRTFGPLMMSELSWRDSNNSTPGTALVGRLATFRIFFQYRYHASWQGTVMWLESKETYQFDSFLDLLRIVDRILTGQAGLAGDAKAPDISCGRCQIAADGCGEDLQGEVRRAAVNYRKGFSSVSALADCMAEVIQKPQPVGTQIVSGEMLNAYRRDGDKATFTICVLYRQHTTWQGTVYCRELKEAKSFRSFMELLYLMASAVEAVKKGYIENNSSVLHDRGCAVRTS